jgi:hypothetical protein
MDLSQDAANTPITSSKYITLIARLSGCIFVLLSHLDAKMKKQKVSDSIQISLCALEAAQKIVITTMNQKMIFMEVSYIITRLLKLY